MRRANSPRAAGRPHAAGRQGAEAWVGFALRLAAASVWLAAGIAKMPAIRDFRLLVEKYGLIPGPLVGPFAYALPFVEVGIGLYLAAGLLVRGTALAGTLLMGIFLAAQASAWARGLVLDCGCFGTALSATVGPLTMLRDAALGIPTFLMLALPARGLSVDKHVFGGRDAFAEFARKMRKKSPRP